MFTGCLDILRDNETITGYKALRNMTCMLILKLIEPRIGKEILLDNYEYDFRHICPEEQTEYKNKLLAISRYSKLAELNEDDIPNNLKYLWDDILSYHEVTQKIFIKDNGFDIKRGSSFKRLMNKLNAVNFDSIPNDVLGDAYGDLIKYVAQGKVFGQFFTPHIIKELAIQLLNPQVHLDGKIETCCDPTAGTGGFLTNYLKEIKKQATEKKIELDWNFIKKSGIYGREIDPDTYQLAAANMLITTGYICEGLINGDSIRKPITQKFDNVISNPPFGISGLLYDSYAFAEKQEYLPIKTDNAASLIIQAIIYMLKINGKGVIVLPTGQDITSKSGSYVSIREYLMKTCDLQEVIYFPSGVFEYTGINTCILYFIKKVEGKTVLEVKTSGKKRTYRFTDIHHTESVKFYNYDIITKVKTLLINVPIHNIANNKYSLNYSDYIETIDETYASTIEVKQLEEIVIFQNGSQLDTKNIIEGTVPIFGGGLKIVGYHNVHNRNGNETIVCGTGNPGYVKYNYNSPFWASQCFTMKSKNLDILNDKYLYYYSKHFLENIFISKQVGSAQKYIRYTQLLNIKIPLPPHIVQTIVVDKLDRIYESINEVNNSIETYRDANIRQLERVSIIDHKLITLGELCTFLPKSKHPASYGKKEGKYKFYVSSMNSKFCDVNDYKEECLIIGDGGEPNVNYDTNFSTSDHCIVLRNRNNQTLNLKYVYYYIFNNLDYMKNLYIGMGLKNITKPRVANIKIRIPPLEIQNQIVAACDRRNEMIANLETFIEELKLEAKEILNDALRNAPMEPDVEDIYEYKTEDTDEKVEQLEDD